MNVTMQRLAAALLFMAATGTRLLAQDNFDVCQKTDLLRALAYVYYGCGEICDKKVIKQLDSGVIDRPTLMGILSSPRVTVRHLFFGMKDTAVEEALDWEIRGAGSKREQILSLKTAVDRGGMLFILGKASTLDAIELNEKLSKERMESVRRYLDEVGVKCDATKGGWFGEEAFQFDESDAGRLGVRPYEYRSPSPADFEKMGSKAYAEAQQRAGWTLNQAVHIIFVPCSPKALFLEHRSLIWYHHRESRQHSGDERVRQEQIRNTLFRNDRDSGKFDAELCAYCTGKGNLPAGSPSNASRREACDLVQGVRLSKQPCSR